MGRDPLDVELLQGAPNLAQLLRRCIAMARPGARFETSWLYPCRPIPVAHAARYSDPAAAGSPRSNHAARNRRLTAWWHLRSWRSGTVSPLVLPANRVPGYPTAPVPHTALVVHASCALVPPVPGAPLSLSESLTKEQRDRMTPAQVIDELKKGNERFRTGRMAARNYLAEKRSSAAGQYPAAVVLGCLDSRAPAEIIF